MRNIILYCTLLISFLGLSCEQIGYKTTPSGLKYLFLEKHPEGLQPKSGQILKLLFKRSIGSPLSDTVAQVDYASYNPAQIKDIKTPYNIGEIFSYLHEGDSVLVVVPLDSILTKERDLRNIPNYQPGKTVNFYIKLLKILPNDSAYKQDVQQSQELAIQQEPQKIISYARRHRLFGTLKNGVVVSLGRRGTGPVVEAGDTLELRYSGFLVGKGPSKAFDSNFPVEGQVKTEPLSFVVGSQEMIEGLNNAVVDQRVGDSINVLIPSKLAYGTKGAGHLIPPNSSLHFCLRLEKLRKARKG